MGNNPLGRAVDYPQRYAPELLHPVERQINRGRLGLSGESLPFVGFDLWRAFELSWLNSKGRPEVAFAEFTFPCDSPRLVESKSLKLYLNSLNQERYPNSKVLVRLLEEDLSAAAGAEIKVNLLPLSAGQPALNEPAGQCLDALDITASCYKPDPTLLRLREQSVGSEYGDTPVNREEGREEGPGKKQAERQEERREKPEEIEEELYSDLFRSNCPITSQPDWGSVSIAYRGRPMDHHALLAYIISFRTHEGFHEDCAEQIFCDIMRQCQPSSLTVAINFLRRGGLDINPLRSTGLGATNSTLPRLLRQ